MAHGFASLTDLTLWYLVDSYYNPDDELGVAWDDPAIAADWGVADPVVSLRDQSNPQRSQIDPGRAAEGRAQDVNGVTAPGRDRLGSPNTGVLVTGGGSGIGRQTAIALAEVGRPVAIWDIDAEGAEETAVLCRDLHGTPACWSVVDVADTAGLEAAVPRAAAELGTLGGFVHAPGFPGSHPWTSSTTKSGTRRST